MKYLNEIGAQYVMNDRTTAESEKIPEPLRGFYNTFQSADLPYGRIYDLDTALVFPTKQNSVSRSASE